MRRRKRSISPAIWEDEKVQSLSGDEFKLYIYLISNADDEGRLEVDPEEIYRGAFPGRTDLGAPDIARMINAMATDRLVGLYKGDGDDQVFLHHPRWRRYQKVCRPSKSRLPDPADYDRLVCSVDDNSMNSISPNSMKIPEFNELTGNSMNSDDRLVCSVDDNSMNSAQLKRKKKRSKKKEKKKERILKSTHTPLRPNLTSTPAVERPREEQEPCQGEGKKDDPFADYSQLEYDLEALVSRSPSCLPPPPHTPRHRQTEDSIVAAFCRNREPFAQPARQRKAIDNLIRKAKNCVSDDYEKLILRMINKFADMRIGRTKFMARQPFTPARLNALFDEVYEASEHDQGEEQIRRIEQMAAAEGRI